MQSKRRLICSEEIEKNEMNKSIKKRQVFFSPRWFIEWLFLFCFWENIFFTSYVACCVICSCRKAFKQPFTDVLKNFAIFTGKHLCLSLLLTMLLDWRPALLFKKRPHHSCFPVNIEKFLGIAFSQSTYLFIFRNSMWG